MQCFFPRLLAVRAILAGLMGATAVQAGGIPVFDVGNLNESMRQTAKQHAQLQTQRDQLKNMELNTERLSVHHWDQATQTMGRLRSTLDTFNRYRQLAGSLDNHLAQFKDVDGYRASECFSTGCTAAQWSQMREGQGQRGALTQKSANDALLRGLDQQHRAMEVDANRLERLQESAQGAQGQMQALDAANQFASHLAFQLQQIRALLIAQQTALAARQQVLADREALAEAAQERALAPRIGSTPSPLNWLSLKP